MGDPKKLKKKYSTPVHPWNKNNIEAERKIKQDYGLSNKKEIFRANSFLKKYKNIAKKLIAKKTLQGEKETEQVLGKLQRLGLLPSGADLDQVLGLEMKDVLERRLQSIVFKNGLARSMKQARQFITHRHIMIADKEISIPSYLVSLEEEGQLKFKSRSSLANELHPERVEAKKEETAPEESKKEKEEKKETNKEKKSVEEKAETKEKIAESPKEEKETQKEEAKEQPQEKTEEAKE